MKKGNVIEQFKEMIENSWTYAKMTDQEKENWNDVINNGITERAVKGTYKQRWEILQAIYNSFLNALNYKNGLWREEE